MTLNKELLSQGFTLKMATPGKTPLVQRDTETFHPDNGISWYQGAKVGDFDTTYSDLWLPSQTLALLNNLDQHGGITLVGTVGAGKSTLLYGARALMRVRGVPYVNINGHYNKTGVEEVVQAIDSSEENGMTIIYDSADYLMGGSRRIRSLPLSKHIPRNLAIMRRLIELRQRGGNLLLSSHHQDWIDDRAHPDLLPTWNELTSHTVPEEVDIALPEFEERAELLRKIGLSGDIADFIAQLPNDSNFLNYILHKWGDKRYMDWAQQKLSRYEILKLLARDNYKENEPVIDTVTGTLAGDRPEAESWDAVLKFTYSKSYLLTFFTK